MTPRGYTVPFPERASRGRSKLRAYPAYLQCCCFGGFRELERKVSPTRRTRRYFEVLPPGFLERQPIACQRLRHFPLAPTQFESSVWPRQSYRSLLLDVRAAPDPAVRRSDPLQSPPR